MSDHTPRQPPGTPSGGQFARKVQRAPKSGLDTGRTGDRASFQVMPPFRVDPESEAKMAAIARARTPEELSPYVTDPDPMIRADVAAHDALSREQAMSLTGDSSPLVRFELSDRWGDPDLADALSNDSDPIVRHRCLHNPTIPQDVKDRLLADSEVRRIEVAVRQWA